MNLSVLIPARGRPEYLSRSIRSILKFALDPSGIEILVRLDDDDGKLDENVVVASELGARVTVGERWGYARTHDYFNQLAEQSCGAWIVNWNDDMEMMTYGYDLLLGDCKKMLAVQMPRRDTVGTSDHTVPVTSRAVYEALGHLSLSSLCDAWMSEVAIAAGIVIARDDVEFHHYCLPACERAPFDDIATFRSADMERLRQVDVAKLRSL